MSKSEHRHSARHSGPAAARAARRRRLVVGAAALIVIGTVLVVAIGRRGGKPTTSAGRSPSPVPQAPEGILIPNGPALADTRSAATGAAVHGIRCEATQQLAYTFHAHLAIFVNGAARQIPLGIGVPDAVTTGGAEGPIVAAGSCYYWLETHAADGIIDVESPTKRAFTLGDFFDIWGQTLGPTQVGSAAGAVGAFYNGTRYAGADPRDIPITAHAQIQLDVGQPQVPPQTISFGNL